MDKTATSSMSVPTTRNPRVWQNGSQLYLGRRDHKDPFRELDQCGLLAASSPRHSQ